MSAGIALWLFLILPVIGTFIQEFLAADVLESDLKNFTVAEMKRLKINSTVVLNIIDVDDNEIPYEDKPLYCRSALIEPGRYLVELSKYFVTDICIRHELYHIAAGHIDFDEKNRLNPLFMYFLRGFYFEPAALWYSVIGWKQKK